MIDTQTPGSPGWWIMRLQRELIGDRDRLSLLRAWFEGAPPLPVVNPAARDVVHDFIRKCRTNFAELIVEAARERMTPIGFRTGAPDDLNGDVVAWDFWRANNLDVVSADVHGDALALGRSYVAVGDDDSGMPVITGEDPLQVITAHDPIRPNRTIAALKLFHDDIAGRDYAYLWLPGELHVAFRERLARASTAFQVSATAFEWDPDLSKTFDQDIVPVTRFENRRGKGEFEPHIALMERINFMVLHRLTIATLQAFRQRAVKGELPTHDNDGVEIDYNDVFSADPLSLWLLPEGVDIWESGQVDLAGILKSVSDDVQHLAAVSRTPLYFLNPEAAQGSAEGAALQREGVVFRTEDRISRMSPSWAQVMSNAFRVAGDDQRADLKQLRVLWAPVERYSLTERASAATQATAGGLPWRERMTDIFGYPPSQLQQLEADRAADSLMASLAAPPVTPGV